MSEEKRKRTLEALERRFCQAQVQLCHKITATPTPIQDNECHSSNRAGWMKWRLAAGYYAIRKYLIDLKLRVYRKQPIHQGGGVELNDPTYFQLSGNVDKNVLGTTTEIFYKKKTVDSILHELLRQGDSAQKYRQGSKSVRVDNWILLDNAVQKSRTSSGARIRASRSRSKRSKRHMSLKQQKKCGSFELSQEFQNFNIFKPMHESWKSYVTNLLKNVGKNQLSQCLLNADLHGAVIIVVKCKIAGLIGVQGIMIRETIETFGMVTEDNKFRVPKKLSVFMLQVDCWKITLLGDKLTSRNMIT